MITAGLQIDPRITAIHNELGIAENYAQQCAMPLQAECSALVAVDDDVFGRPARLETETALAWQAMQTAASAAGISLLLISAFRSYDYQKQLFERKLAKGNLLANILKVNAAPGYSEHHSGRALDLGCHGFSHLEESFETSPAFAWLQQHAASFGFSMSFPRNNPFGVSYEPWHWCHQTP